MWARVFTAVVDAPAPDVIAEHLTTAGCATQARADADEQGWFHVDLATCAGNVTVDRYGADEGIRADLNSWAAWLEVHAGPHADRLMQHMIATPQIITLRFADEVDGDLRRAVHAVCRFLASATGGVYQLDGEGFFDADGTRLVAEE